jgi:hypothetical protein
MMLVDQYPLVCVYRLHVKFEGNLTSTTEVMINIIGYIFISFGRFKLVVLHIISLSLFSLLSPTPSRLRTATYVGVRGFMFVFNLMVLLLVRVSRHTCSWNLSVPGLHTSYVRGSRQAGRQVAW